MSWGEMSWRRVKQFFCRHRYSDANLTSCSVGASGRAVLLRNYCVKCGKPFEVRMSGRYIDNMIEEDKKRL